MKRGKACTMAKVKYITSANEIPAGQECLLVMYVKNTLPAQLVDATQVPNET
jgi:hypothetical protein